MVLFFTVVTDNRIRTNGIKVHYLRIEPVVATFMHRKDSYCAVRRSNVHEEGNDLDCTERTGGDLYDKQQRCSSHA